MITEYTLMHLDDGSLAVREPTIDREDAFARKKRLNDRGGNWVVVSRTTSDWDLVEGSVSAESKCLVHGIPDCSPLLNGCSRLSGRI